MQPCTEGPDPWRKNSHPAEGLIRPRLEAFHHHILDQNVACMHGEVIL